jgi:hypothetical protein
MMPPGTVQCLLVLFFINVIEYGFDIETGVDVVTAQGMLTHLLLALTGLLTRRRLKRAVVTHSVGRLAQRDTGTIAPSWSAVLRPAVGVPVSRPPLFAANVLPGGALLELDADVDRASWAP